MADVIKKYHVEFSRRAQKKIDKLDSKIRTRILNWINNKLEGCENPRLHGHSLEGDLRNYWRYRVGDYRLVAEIFDDKILILIVNVDKRDSVYK